MKRTKISLLIIIGIILTSCGRKPTVFRTDTYKGYSVQVPTYMTLKDKGWIFDNGKKLEFIQMYVADADSMNLQENLSSLIKMNTTKDKKLLGMQFQEQKDSTANGNQFLWSLYTMNNNKNTSGYKVMTYYVFAVTRIRNKIIAFQSFALGRNNQQDMEKTVLSIQPTKSEVQ